MPSNAPKPNRAARRLKSRQPLPHRLVTIAEGSDYSRVPTGTLRHWIRVGRLPAWRMGPRILRINLDDLDALRRPIPTVTAKRKVAEG